MWELLEKSYLIIPLGCWHQAPTSQSPLAHKFLLGILFATHIIHSPILYPYTITIRVGTVRLIVLPVSSHYGRQGLSRSPFVDALHHLICQASPEASIGKWYNLLSLYKKACCLLLDTEKSRFKIRKNENASKMKHSLINFKLQI